jgi:hypothetical protein
MSGVVLRCPSCGTTRAALGECDVCHEAQVRFYCTNHTPGRWLDSGSCPKCGSQFGVSDRPPLVHSPPRSSPASPPRQPGAPPPPAAALPPKAGRKGYTSWPARGPWGRPVLPGHERETRPRSDAFREAIERRLPDRFREAARVRRMREGPDLPPIWVATGCLRPVLLMLLFFVLASLAMPLLLSAFIQLMSQ